MFNRVTEGTRLALDGLFGPRFGYFEVLENVGKLPQDIDRYVDYRLVVRRPAAASVVLPVEPLREAA